MAVFVKDSVETANKVDCNNLGGFQNRSTVVLGSGSLFVAVEVEMSDGKKQVLCIKRPDARERAVYGFETLSNMVTNLQPGQIKDTLSELLHSAQAKLDIEVDCLIAENQYDVAQTLYQDSYVEIHGTKIRFKSANVSASGGGFYMMDKIDGQHFSELETDGSVPKETIENFSMAILVKELSNILQGQFCNDRHGGNVKINDSTVGHIDFKALSLKPWSQQGYDQFSEILVQIVMQSDQIQSADDFVNKFLDYQAVIRNRAELIEPFVSEIQKALLSNSEYARNLNPEQLSLVLLSAIASGMNDQIPIPGFSPLMIRKLTI